MEMNFEVLNFLNMIDPYLGTLYKQGKFGYLTDTFVLSDKHFLSRMNLDKFSDNIKYPEFLFENDKKTKKIFKKSLKNNKKLIKNVFFDNFLNNEDNFEIGIYLIARIKIFENILKEYSGSKFDPFKIYDKLFSLNPVLEEILSNSFDDIDDVEKFLLGLSVKYKENYEEKLRAINIKGKRCAKKLEKEIFENALNRQPVKLAKTKNVETLTKKSTKTIKNLTKTTNKDFKEKI